jgi:hypothetical protein
MGPVRRFGAAHQQAEAVAFFLLYTYLLQTLRVVNLEIKNYWFPFWSFFDMSFEEDYASGQEVKTAEDVVRGLLESHWPQIFSFGNVVLWMCMDAQTVVLVNVRVNPKLQREPQVLRVVLELQAACDKLNAPLLVGFEM